MKAPMEATAPFPRFVYLDPRLAGVSLDPREGGGIPHRGDLGEIRALLARYMSILDPMPN